MAAQRSQGWGPVTGQCKWKPGKGVFAYLFVPSTIKLSPQFGVNFTVHIVQVGFCPQQQSFELVDGLCYVPDLYPDR